MQEFPVFTDDFGRQLLTSFSKTDFFNPTVSLTIAFFYQSVPFHSVDERSHITIAAKYQITNFG
jgi:hypothetical protein